MVIILGSVQADVQREWAQEAHRVTVEQRQHNPQVQCRMLRAEASLHHGLHWLEVPTKKSPAPPWPFPQ